MAPLVLLGLFLAFPVLSATGQLPQLNDLFVLGKGDGQKPDLVPVQTNPEPAQVATPRAECGPGGKPEPDIQGRVPAGAAADGLRCNAHDRQPGNSGGFKVLRYVDKAGHECAFYDTALLFPLNAVQPRQQPRRRRGARHVATRPSRCRPRTLTEPAMLRRTSRSTLNTKRGLLAAVCGNPSTYPGLVSIYDVSQDCRHPVLQSTRRRAPRPRERLLRGRQDVLRDRHAYKSITAIDVTDPKNPHVVWQGNIARTGCRCSPTATAPTWPTRRRRAW